MATYKTLTVSSPPHIYGKDTVFIRMRDVLIALAPACLMGIYRFGRNAALIVALSVISALLAEWLYQKVVGKPVTIGDLSAAITGLLLGLNLPPGVPLWLPVFGSFFAIIAVKQLFGGLGSNFMNPALAARAFLLIAFPVHMTSWLLPGSNPDAVTGATFLAIAKNVPGFVPNVSDYVDLIVGNVGGSIGELSAATIIIGGIYLIARRIINWRTPVFYLGSFALFAFVFGRNGLFTGNALFELLSGGLMLGAFFMATDYATSPITPDGKAIMGIGCGFLTVMIRVYGGFPEGVCFAIIIMNVFVPTIDKYIRPTVYGKKKMVGGNR